MAADICNPMTSERTRLFLCMRRIPEEARVIGTRAEIPVWEAMQWLEEMEYEGLVCAYHERGKPSLYHPIQPVSVFARAALRLTGPGRSNPPWHRKRKPYHSTRYHR
jgi:hypothetical protein